MRITFTFHGLSLLKVSGDEGSHAHTVGSRNASIKPRPFPTVPATLGADAANHTRTRVSSATKMSFAPDASTGPTRSRSSRCANSRRSARFTTLVACENCRIASVEVRDMYASAPTPKAHNTGSP
jgi:hypothetical protein